MPAGPTRTRLALACALSAGGLGLLAGCGSTTHVGANRSIVLGLTEYRITPQRVEAHSGELSINVRNLGRLTHNLSVLASGQAVDSTKPIPPGQSAWLYLDLAPGSYTMASTLFSDQDLGQYGTLIVDP